jgi:hypothetical protein
METLLRHAGARADPRSGSDLGRQIVATRLPMRSAQV